MASDQMYTQMRQAALARLVGRDPRQIAENAGIRYDEGRQVFLLSTMGIFVTVQYPQYTLIPELPSWHTLVILHYLDLADGAALAESPISFGQMRDGLVRGGGIDRKCEMAIRELKHLDEGAFTKLCQRLGGAPITTNADLACRIPFLPRFPVVLKIWLPDEDFPASGRLMPDASADHYLTIEDAVTVAEILLERMVQQDMVHSD